MNRRRGAFIVAGCLAAGISTASCFEFGTGVSVVELTFNQLPGPAVVVGDTLRDSTGAATQLTAIVRGSNRTAQFLALDTAITVSADGWLIARSRDTSASAANRARVLAQVGDLQTPARIAVITVRHDAVVQNGSAPGALRYDPAAQGAVADTANRSAPVAVRVRHLYSAGEAGAAPRDTIVKSYLVTYHLSGSVGIADSVRLIDDNGRASAVDTTDASGIASRRIRVYPRPTATASDSVVVLVRVRYRNGDISGSPLRMVLPLIRR
jgi:hypothetical protein